MKAELQVWILGGAISLLLIILGFVLAQVSSYLGKKIDKTVEVNERLISEIAQIKTEIKSLFHSINTYEISMSNVEKRLRDLEIDHAKNSYKCPKE